MSEEIIKPIYISAGMILPEERIRLEKASKRPVCLVYGNPKEVVYDSADEQDKQHAKKSEYEQMDEDLGIYGQHITKDGKRVDPKELFKPSPSSKPFKVNNTFTPVRKCEHGKGIGLCEELNCSFNEVRVIASSEPFDPMTIQEKANCEMKEMVSGIVHPKEPLVDSKEDDDVEELAIELSYKMIEGGSPEEQWERIPDRNYWIARAKKIIEKGWVKRKPELVPLDEELKKSLQLKNHYFYPEIASFIMEDRKRICDSLVKLKSKYEPIQWLARLEDNYCGTDDLCKAIDETLKRAGLLNRKDG